MEKKLSIVEPQKEEQDLGYGQLYSDQYARHAKAYRVPFYEGHLFTRTYGVAIEMYDGQKDKKSQVQFEAEITMRKFLEEGCLEYKIKKNHIFINKRTPKTLVEKLSVKTLEALYPLEIQTTLKNELQQIINHEEILERWQKIKMQLQKEYIGKAITQYINAFETKISNNYILLQSLKHEVFYTLLFHDIYAHYDISSQKVNTSLQKEATIAFPVLGFKSPLLFKGIQKINKYKTYYNTANSYFNAQIDNKPITAKLDVEYDLDGISFLLENIIAKCHIKHNSTIIKTVNASIFHLKEKPTILKSLEEMQDDINRRENAKKDEENKDLTLKQRFTKWLNI